MPTKAPGTTPEYASESIGLMLFLSSSGLGNPMYASLVTRDYLAYLYSIKRISDPEIMSRINFAFFILFDTFLMVVTVCASAISIDYKNSYSSLRKYCTMD